MASKKLPPKMLGGEMTASTPTKAAHDEILSSLLRINNFDSISSIKDESLDIDLSACVTISPAGLINGNSLSSTDFWRVLDESAQNAAELNLSESKEELSVIPSTTIANISNSSASSENQSSEFSVTFLRPEPPNAFTNSPFKKNGSAAPVKIPQPDINHSHQPSSHLTKVKLPAATTVRLKVFKEEPPEEQNQPAENVICLESKKEVCDAAMISSAFSIFQQPKTLNENNSVDDASNVADPNQQQNFDKTNEQTSPPEIKMVPTYKCLDCNGLVLSGQEEMSTHERMSHRTRLFYKCGECEREFDLLTGLKKHLKTHRTEGRKDTWKKCPDCGKCLKLGSMWMHRKIHTDNKKYVCDICGQKFVQKINLTHHARIHSSEKPYECPECQKRFQERSHLQRHQKYHAQTRSYRCEKCGKMYKTERCLKVHNLVHLEQRPFACNVCDKSFISNSKLKQHSNIHTGMRPFKCNYCPRDFTNFPNWLKHTRRRHKVDHKTGEHLENIPSYCSKKSTSKAQKAAAAEKEQSKANSTPTTTSVTNNTAAVTTATPAFATILSGQMKPPSGSEVIKAALPVKTTRRKKQPQQNNTALSPAVTPNTVLQKGKQQQAIQAQPLQQQQPPAQMPVMVVAATKRTVPAVGIVNNTASSAPVATLPKQVKAKRERKQLTPKQLQKAPAVAPLVNQIKKEPVSEVNLTPFIDLHGLSLTSAEDLIMEQALEMEECYDTPSADIGTDNAISSETAAALHFQVKSEINDDKEDEYVPLKKNERLACPSLESSPFSSPASIELTSMPSVTSGTTVTSSNYYLPSFALNAQGAIVKSLGGLRGVELTSTINDGSINKVTTTTLPTLLTTAGSTAATTTTVVNLPLLVRPSQMLPSVDTLLFSSNSGTRFYTASKTVTAQQNLSSSTSS